MDQTPFAFVESVALLYGLSNYGDQFCQLKVDLVILSDLTIRCNLSLINQYRPNEIIDFTNLQSYPNLRPAKLVIGFAERSFDDHIYGEFVTYAQALNLIRFVNRQRRSWDFSFVVTRQNFRCPWLQEFLGEVHFDHQGAKEVVIDTVDQLHGAELTRFFNEKIFNQGRAIQNVWFNYDGSNFNHIVKLIVTQRVMGITLDCALDQRDSDSQLLLAEKIWSFWESSADPFEFYINFELFIAIPEKRVKEGKYRNDVCYQGDLHFDHPVLKESFQMCLLDFRDCSDSSVACIQFKSG